MITEEARNVAVSKSASGGLLTLTELALVFDVGRDFVKAMTRAGFKTFGGKTTRDDALQWLRDNPDFKDRQHRQGRNSSKLSRNSAIQRRNTARTEQRSRSRDTFKSKGNGKLTNKFSATGE